MRIIAQLKKEKSSSPQSYQPNSEDRLARNNQSNSTIHRLSPTQSHSCLEGVGEAGDSSKNQDLLP